MQQKINFNKYTATARKRTRTNCLEGNYANYYTTNYCNNGGINLLGVGTDRIVYFFTFRLIF